MYLSILILPLLGSIVSGLLGRKVGITGAHLITCSCLIVSSVLATVAFYEVGICGSPVYIHLFSWVDSEFMSVSWEFSFDQLTVSLQLAVLYCSTLIHIYSVDYLSSDPHQQRFMSYLSLFTFGMLVLISGANYFVMFVGWELIGVVSYLLINFYFTRIQANKAAILALTMNRVGDMGLSIGFFAIFAVFGSVNYSTVFSLAPFMNETAITIISLLIFSGAMAKSSQIPLHSWLPGSMEAPTPVSALLHAATLVTAGVYLLVRSSPILEYSSTALLVITLIGASTAFFAATAGLLQNDLKRIIAFSTISQLGYMVMAVGLSQHNVAMFHTINHAFFKALLFLGAGAVIHSFADQQDVRKMGGLINFLPFTFTCMLVGSLSLLATPFLTGFYSKDLIIELAFAQYSFSGTYAYILGSVTACLTAFYSVRLISLVFLTVPNGAKSNYINTHESNIQVIIPLFLLSLFSIVFGYFTSDMFIGMGSDFFGNSLFIHPNRNILADAEFSLPIIIKLLPAILSLFGASLALYLYNFNPEILINLTESSIGRKVYTFLNGKYLFDVVYNNYIIGAGLQLAYTISKVLDKGIIELAGPHGLSTSLSSLAKDISKQDTGHVTTYALYIILWLLTFILIVSAPLITDTSIADPRVLIVFSFALVSILTESGVKNLSNSENNNKKISPLLHSNNLITNIKNKSINKNRSIYTLIRKNKSGNHLYKSKFSIIKSILKNIIYLPFSILKREGIVKLSLYIYVFICVIQALILIINLFIFSILYLLSISYVHFDIISNIFSNINFSYYTITIEESTGFKQIFLIESSFPPTSLPTTQPMSASWSGVTLDFVNLSEAQEQGLTLFSNNNNIINNQIEEDQTENNKVIVLTPPKTVNSAKEILEASYEKREVLNWSGRLTRYLVKPNGYSLWVEENATSDSAHKPLSTCNFSQVNHYLYIANSADDFRPYTPMLFYLAGSIHQINMIEHSMAHLNTADLYAAQAELNSHPLAFYPNSIFKFTLEYEDRVFNRLMDQLLEAQERNNLNLVEAMEAATGDSLNETDLADGSGQVSNSGSKSSEEIEGSD